MITIYTCEDLRTFSVFEAVQAGDLRGTPVYKDEYSKDPVFNCRYIYEDGGWSYIGIPPKRPRPEDPDTSEAPPECGENCKWRQTFSHDRQKNALRIELAHFVEPYRCGWNIKLGRIGGRPLDYAPCTFSGA